MHTFYIILLLLNIFVLFLQTVLTIERIQDEAYVIKRYYETFIDAPEKQRPSICDIDKMEKFNICQSVFSEKSFQKQFGIYLNKYAFHMHTVDCEEEILTIDLPDTENNGEIKQMIFPCYGRHDPMQTDWNEDDYYDFVYLSAGPDRHSSVFIYFYNLLPEGGQFYVREIMRDFDLKSENNYTYDMLEKESAEELETANKEISYSMDYKFIEMNYVRDIIKGDGFGWDSVCDLITFQKYHLCDKVINHSEKYFVIPDKYANESEVTCKMQKIVFLSRFPDDIPKTFEQRMYPCYGKTILTEHKRTDLYYVGDGYRKNSVLLFLKLNGKPDTFIFEKFVQNLNTSELKSEPIQPIMSFKEETESMPDFLLELIGHTKDEKTTSTEAETSVVESSSQDPLDKAPPGFKDVGTSKGESSSQDPGRVRPAGIPVSKTESTEMREPFPRGSRGSRGRGGQGRGGPRRGNRGGGRPAGK